MNDVILESFRAVVTGGLVIFLMFFSDRQSSIKQAPGWRYIIWGFSALFFGSVIDITDNFDSLNRFIIIGDTEYQAFLEKIIGYLFGFLFLAIGFWKWLPQIIEYQRNAEDEINSLKQILPICSYCKKIRDDKGYWGKLEAYVARHTKKSLSHGICNECAKEHFPDLELYDDK